MATNTPAIPTNAEAARDLHRILDQIAADYGTWRACAAAVALRIAACEGRIDGMTYLMTSSGCACVVGHLSAALDLEPWEAVRVWLKPPDPPQFVRYRSPVEALVGCVGPGDTPQTNRDLAALLGMLDDWLSSAAEREVTP